MVTLPCMTSSVGQVMITGMLLLVVQSALAQSAWQPSNFAGEERYLVSA